MMRAMIWIVGALFLALVQAASFGCGGSESAVTCNEGGCECVDRTSCSLDCEDIVGCQPSCTAVKDDCSATCTAEDCEVRCRSADNCGVLCGDNCYVACSAVTQACQAETGVNSDFNCINSRNCAAELGDNSVASCIGTGTCFARCLGSCLVDCTDADTCSVDCQEGEKLNCGQGRFTCGRPCP